MYAEAFLALQETSIVAPLARQAELAGNSVNVNTVGTVTPVAMTEGVELAVAQTLTNTSANKTPVKYGAKVTLTDEAIRRAEAGNFQAVEAGRPADRASPRAAN